MIVTLTLNPALDKVLWLTALAPGGEIHARMVSATAAGKGVNVARMVSRLGGATLALWVCGGPAGREMATLLSGEGLPNQPLPVAGAVRTNYTLVEEDAAGRATRIFEPGPELSGEEAESVRAEALSSVAGADFLVLSGSLPGGAAGGLYPDLIAASRLLGVRAVLDSRGDALRQGLGAGPFLVKCNEVEAREATGVPVGDPKGLRLALRRLRELGATMAVVSLGQAGAALSTPDGTWFATSPPVTVASPVGSGDCLLAALAWALDSGRPPGEALRWGTAAGAANAAVWTPAGCSREEVEQLLPEVTVTKED